MSLVQRLRDDLNQSLKKRDKERVLALRLVLADINNAEIAKRVPLDEAGLLGVVSKRVKQYRESIDAFRKGNREDLVAREEKERGVALIEIGGCTIRTRRERRVRSARPCSRPRTPSRNGRRKGVSRSVSVTAARAADR